MSCPEVVTKPWGREIWYARVEDKYVGKVLEVTAGHRLSLQYHVQKDETITLVSGIGYLELGPVLNEIEKVELRPFVGVHVPPGWLHRLGAISDMRCLEVSTDHLDDVVRLEDDYARR